MEKFFEELEKGYKEYCDYVNEFACVDVKGHKPLSEVFDKIVAMDFYGDEDDSGRSYYRCDIELSTTVDKLPFEISLGKFVLPGTPVFVGDIYEMLRSLEYASCHGDIDSAAITSHFNSMLRNKIIDEMLETI